MKGVTTVRVAHLLRVVSYMDIAMIAMWTNNPRASVMMGMVAACLRHKGPAPEDEPLLRELRGLVAEAQDFYAGGDFPAAMARMRVADDLASLRLIHASNG